MKKYLLSVLMLIGGQSALAQLPGAGELFHEGPATEKAAEAMAQEMLAEILSNAEKNKDMSEEQAAEMIMEFMKKQSGKMKEAMKEDCSANNSAKDCACFYDKVDLGKMFDEMKKFAAQPDISEEEVEKQLNPLLDEYKAQKAQCGLK